MLTIPSSILPQRTTLIMVTAQETTATSHLLTMSLLTIIILMHTQTPVPQRMTLTDPTRITINLSHPSPGSNKLGLHLHQNLSVLHRTPDLNKTNPVANPQPRDDNLVPLHPLQMSLQMSHVGIVLRIDVVPLRDDDVPLHLHQLHRTLETIITSVHLNEKGRHRHPLLLNVALPEVSTIHDQVKFVHHHSHLLPLQAQIQISIPTQCPPHLE